MPKGCRKSATTANQSARAPTVAASQKARKKPIVGWTSSSIRKRTIPLETATSAPVANWRILFRSSADPREKAVITANCRHAGSEGEQENHRESLPALRANGEHAKLRPTRIDYETAGEPIRKPACSRTDSIRSLSCRRFFFVNKSAAHLGPLPKTSTLCA